MYPAVLLVYAINLHRHYREECRRKRLFGCDSHYFSMLKDLTFPSFVINNIFMRLLLNTVSLVEIQLYFHYELLLTIL